MKKRKWGVIFHLAWVTAALVGTALLLWPRGAQAPVEKKAEELPTPPAESVAGEGARLEADAQVIQTMAFSRCGHSVTRRVGVPEKLRGAGFEEARAYYASWEIESFSPEQAAMRREIPLYCPMHAVLEISEAGEAVLSRNVYGDGMAVEKTYALSLEELSPEDRQALLLGVGFDSAEEAEQWLRDRTNSRGE